MSQDNKTASIGEVYGQPADRLSALEPSLLERIRENEEQSAIEDSLHWDSPGDTYLQAAVERAGLLGTLIDRWSRMEWQNPGSGFLKAMNYGYDICDNHRRNDMGDE